MSPGPHAEPARLQDLDEVLAIAAQSFARPWSRSLLARALEDDRALALVMRGPDGVIQGYLFARGVLDELTLEQVAVAPATRCMGVAARLLIALEEEARRRRAHVVHLEVAGRNDAALRLYERAGYQIVGRRPHYYPDGDDALLLSRYLEVEEGCA